VAGHTSSLLLRQTVPDGTGTPARADDVTLNSAEATNGLHRICPQHFRAALTASGKPVTRAFRIAGHAVRLHFADDVIARRLTRAFAHLEGDTQEPELTVNAWQSTGIAAPPLPAIHSDAATRGAVAHFDDGRARALYQPAIRILNVLDVPQDVGWFWTEDAAGIPEWECATPIRHILHWWLAERGAQQVHAAAVGNKSGGVLVVGKGGSGKSTVSLACATAGMAYAGDDYVAATVTPEPYVHSLYSSAKVEPHHLLRFPALSEGPGVVRPERSEVAPFDTEKTVLYLHELRPDVPVSGFPLRAIVLPKITESGTSGLAPISAPRALAALAPSTIVQLHTAGQDALEAMKRLVAEVPSFELELGGEIDAIAPLVSQLLTDLGSDGTAGR